MPERLIVGAMAMGRAAYALEKAEGEILGVTEVKSRDYNAGIAQRNACRQALPLVNMWW